MKYKTLGHSGLKVSQICFGCMSMGTPGNPAHPWAIGEEESRPLIRTALESGINFFDTANGYSLGASEEHVGRALKDMANRDEIVIATKGFFGWTQGPNTRGNSRKGLIHQLDASLKRLDTDHVDLYQIHRYDQDTPIEETMETLHDLIKAGKIRYIGASSMPAWQFQEAQHVAESHGWAKFISMQCQYSLLYREEEREMLPYCEATNVGVIPWSPLARGLLTRDWGTETRRSNTDRQRRNAATSTIEQVREQQDMKTVSCVAAIAEQRGVTRAQIGLAWHHAKSAVCAPIAGIGKPHHLSDAIASCDIVLTDEELQLLEGDYVDRPAIMSGLDNIPRWKFKLEVRGDTA